MKLTGRLQGQITPGKGQDSAAFLATLSGEQIARQAKIERLRRLVASGRYQVNAESLSRQILTRALSSRR